MRSTRVEKKQRKKKYVRSLLLVFLVIIPLAAVSSSFAIHYAVNRDRAVELPPIAAAPANKEVEAFKYSYDLAAKEFYRVEIKKYDKYEDAEAAIILLKNKKLNGFIIKEQGYLTAFGLYINKSQADTAAKYLSRKNIQGTVNTVDIKSYGIQYDDIDKTLIDLVKATDTAIMKLAEEKSALSLECLYSNKEVGEQSLDAIIEREAQLDRYLNYLETIKNSENNTYVKAGLQELIEDVLIERLNPGESYSYYDLQDSLLNQIEALRRFYDKLMV